MKMKRSVLRVGFTLLELLIVVAIIAILTAIALPRFTDAANRARTSTEKGNIRIIDTQIELYQITIGLFPDYPNAETLLTSTTYFPDGVGEVRDPFTNESGLGVYTVDVTGEPFRKMRVARPKHLCGGGTGKASPPSGHTGLICD